MSLLKVTLTFLLLTTLTSVSAQEICSRVAKIGYQDVLVDSSSTARGEGLRYYLEKDPRAKELLDSYQERNRPSWVNAALSTAGTALILAGLLQTNKDEKGLTSREGLIFSGLSIAVFNYLTKKTSQRGNEELLAKAVEEYNKRQTPKIIFSPYTAPGEDAPELGLGVGVIQDF